MITQRSNRRTFLKTAGALVALPNLASLASARAPQQPSRKVIFYYQPNGVIRKAFFPGEADRPGLSSGSVVKAEKLKEQLRVKSKTGVFPLELSQTLKPLAPFQDKITLVTGLDRTPQGGLDAHGQGSSCYLSSAAPYSIPNTVNAYPQARTLDHIIGDSIGKDTPFKTLELSGNTFKDNKEPAQWDNISWFATGRVAPSIRDPQLLYNRLFSKDLVDSQEVTDLVLEDARFLNRQLDHHDRQKFAEYFDAMRSVEVRIEKLRKRVDLAKLEEVDIAAYLPRGEYLRLMGDILIMALQNNMTNVSTFMVGPERWGSSMMFEGVFDKPVSHHGLSHNQKSEEACRDIMKLDLFYMEQYAYILNRLASIEEIDGSSMLDNTLLHFGTAFGDGASHQYFDIPSVVAGGKNLGIKHGLHIRCKEDSRLADLWLTYARLFGVEREGYSDSNGVISQLTA